MNWISGAIALIALFREAWGLYRDIRKTDKSFRLGHWAKRYKSALRAFRDSKEKDLTELRALSKVIGEKCVGSQCPLETKPN
jgi:hypothetical protein